MRLRIDSMGCRLNIGEAEQLARRLAARGHRVVGQGDAADLMIFNSCAVTLSASRKSRKLIRHWRRANPAAAIVVTGCEAQLSPAAVRELGVDLVVGNQQKDELPAVLEAAGLLHNRQTVPATDATPLETDAAPMTNAAKRRTRAFIKVQDGCDNKCTFCIVTVARGAGRSRATSQIIAEIRELVDAGFQEAVLSGVHLGSFGHDVGEPQGLQGLIRTILRETSVPRLRLSSLEPWDLAPGFFDLWGEDERLQPHVHLPLQSGCDETLQRMARRTNQDDFRRLIDEARAKVPGLSVSTDVIVGFPGETVREFETSLEFVEAMEFSKLHVFRYSPREMTAAAEMPGQVAHATAQERSNRMHALGNDLELRFKRRFVGRTLPVLWESPEPRPEGRQWSGLTGSYVRVVTAVEEGVDLRNRIIDAKITGVVPGGLAAEAQTTAGCEALAM